jgi:uncharacterized protein
VKWYRLAALAYDGHGYPPAQGNLGVLYENGKGAAQDYAEALKWYRRAAVGNYALAQFKLGVLYENGRGVAQDYREALKWYRRAAKQNYAPAQSNLDEMYRRGTAGEN